FAINIVWRANVICTYRKSGIARKTTVAYPELRYKCTPIALQKQKDSFCIVKGLLLEGKTNPFGSQKNSFSK
ncbi:hypothetical protein, partial [Prevotella sp.]|uniref:hypothetical protein n=1 Tax=Prevotella sp. TaxID=59823 RepID=UPI0025E25936